MNTLLKNMEINNLENKAKFFAQYWGQNIIRSNAMDKLYVCSHVNLSHESFWLELKPLSSISDEDAIALGYESAKNLKIASISGDKVIYTENADYLRSKGFALDWNRITVEQQIEYGWIKLIEK